MLVVAAVVALRLGARRVENFRERVARGFAILARPPRVRCVGVIVPQAISWVFRIASLYFFLQGVRRARDVHNALLAQVVDSLATLFPATPGGAGTKQGLIVFLFRGQAISQLAAARVQRRHEHRDRRSSTSLLGLIAIGLMAQDALVQAAAPAPSTRRAGAAAGRLGAVRVRLSARDGARASRASSPTRSTRASASGAIVPHPVRPLARARDRRLARTTRRPTGVDARPIEAVLGEIPAGARRARALDRRLLRLDAGARARARRARDAEAPQGAGAAGRAAGARRARPSRTSSRRRRSRRSRGSSRRWTRAAGTSCSTARPARARPRSTCRRARRRSSAGSARSCSCPRSRSRRRRSAASARASATASRSSTRR